MSQSASGSTIQTTVQCTPEGFDPDQLDPGDAFTVTDCTRQFHYYYYVLYRLRVVFDRSDLCLGQCSANREGEKTITNMVVGLRGKTLHLKTMLWSVWLLVMWLPLILCLFICIELYEQ